MTALSVELPGAEIDRAERVLGAVRDNAWPRFTQMANFRNRGRRDARAGVVDRNTKVTF